MNVLSTVQAAGAMIPIMIQTIKAVEEAIPGEGKGEQKLAMVRGLLESVYSVGGASVTAFAVIWPALETAIEKSVKIFNAVGAFKKLGAAAPGKA